MWTWPQFSNWLFCVFLQWTRCHTWWEVMDQGQRSMSLSARLMRLLKACCHVITIRSSLASSMTTRTSIWPGSGTSTSLRTGMSREGASEGWVLSPPSLVSLLHYPVQAASQWSNQKAPCSVSSISLPELSPSWNLNFSFFPQRYNTKSNLCIYTTNRKHC